MNKYYYPLTQSIVTMFNSYFQDKDIRNDPGDYIRGQIKRKRGVAKSQLW